LLKTQNIDPKQHAVQKEMKRLESFHNKIKEAENIKEKSKLNKDAAKRMIIHSLNEKSDTKNKDEYPEDEGDNEDINTNTTNTNSTSNNLLKKKKKRDNKD